MNSTHGLQGLFLRQLIPQDLGALMDLQEQVLRELPDPMWYMPSTREEHEEDIASGDMFGCWDGQVLVGFAALSPWRFRVEKAYAAKVGDPIENTYDVRDLMVHTGYRRRGISSAFLRVFEEMARKAGGRAIYATIDPGNLPSIRGFEKAGYVHVRTQPAYDGRLRGYYRLALLCC